MTHSTNYFDSFIAVAPDSKAKRGTAPKETTNPTAAWRTYRMIHDHPYRFTSDDVIFTVHADRKAVPKHQRAAAREEFFSRGQACLRASALGKTYGWGIHSDAKGRVALYGVESPEYQAFVKGKRKTSDGRPVAIKQAMRSSRATQR